MESEIKSETGYYKGVTEMPLQIVRQDITEMNVDAVVNTTNENMVAYSGVDRAIHRKAGPQLATECAAIAPLGLGTAKITSGYNLSAKYIIHTAGPVWKGGLHGEEILLRSCYNEALRLAVAYNCESVAFPLICAGNYGFPKQQVLRFATQVIAAFLAEHELSVYLCVYDRTSYEFSKTMREEISALLGDAFVEETHCCEEMLCATVSAEEIGSYNACNTAREGRPSFLQRAFKKESSRDRSLHEYMQHMEKSFAYKLFELIDERGMSDVECYKKANVDKKTFSKLKCNPETYKPSKQTAVAFAIALRLNLDETQELLATAGLTLSRSFAFDIIISYFIQKEIYDVFIINEALFEFDQMLLGC